MSKKGAVQKMVEKMSRDKDGTPRYDGRRLLVTYQTVKGFWKWKFLVNKKVVARSEGQWTYPVQAKEAFEKFKEGTDSIVLSGIFNPVIADIIKGDRVYKCIKKAGV